MRNIRHSSGLIRICQIGSLLVLTTMLLLLPAYTRAASTLYVNATGNDLNDCLSPSSACKTIDLTIRKAAAGDTISIAAGTYKEPQAFIETSKNIDLIGAGVKSTTIESTIINNSAQLTRINSLKIQTNYDCGGVRNLGLLIIADIIIDKNAACSDQDLNKGGGVYNGVNARMQIFNSIISDNWSSVAGYGGGIYNEGEVTLVSSMVLKNAADSGGGIYNLGTLTIINSNIDGNTAWNDRPRETFGGGIYNGGTLNIFTSIIRNNSSVNNGGGIFNQGPNSVLNITNSTISGNSGGVAGGGIDNRASLTIMSSTINGNTNTSDAGGIGNAGALTIINSTISSNSSNQYGGGIKNVGTLNLNNVTITQNSAKDVGGGIANLGGSVNLQNTILAENIKPSTSPDCFGSLTSYGYNLVGNNNGCEFTSTTGDKVGTNGNSIAAKLGPLQDNGGNTLTHMPLADSPAIDAGNPAAPGSSSSTCLATDQRGEPRPFRAACDIGAAERVFRQFIGAIFK